MRRVLVIVILVAALTAAVLLLRPDDEGQGAGNEILVSGVVEAETVEISFQLGGRVVERYVSEGDLLVMGDPVARLDDRELRAAVDLRAAELLAARSVLAELLAGSRPEAIAAAEAAAATARARAADLEAGARPEEIEAAAARTAAARADLGLAQAEMARVERLAADRVLPEEEVDRARRVLQTAEARLAEAKAAEALVRAGPRADQVAAAGAEIEGALARLAEVRAGPREETIAAARARVESAEAALELAEIQLSWAKLDSPISGMVLAEGLESGETAHPGAPVVVVADLDRVWIRAFVPEPELGRVKIGQAVRITGDTDPDRVYEGRVTFLSPVAEFTPKTVQTREERTTLVYRIRVTAANPDHELKPGMPVDAVILVAGDG